MSTNELDTAAVASLLNTQTFGRTIHHHRTVNSTNDVARRLAEAGEPDGTVVCAEEQTAGRGRMERTWVAPIHSSILMSIIVRPSIAPNRLGQLGMAFGLGLANAVHQSTGLNALLKWPNDLMINGRKCAGLLAESAIIGERVDFAIVGIGVNVNWHAAGLTGTLTRATSIADELGHSFPREGLFALLLNRSEDYTARMAKGENLARDWSERCVTLQKIIHATAPWGEEHGIAERIDEQGALIMRRADGSRVTLSAADVSLHLE